MIVSITTGGENYKIRCLSTFLSNELTTKPKIVDIIIIEANIFILHCSVSQLLFFKFLLQLLSLIPGVGQGVTFHVWHAAWSFTVLRQGPEPITLVGHDIQENAER